MRPGDGRDQVQVMDGDARGDPAGLLCFFEDHDRPPQGWNAGGRRVRRQTRPRTTGGGQGDLSIRRLLWLGVFLMKAFLRTSGQTRGMTAGRAVAYRYGTCAGRAAGWLAAGLTPQAKMNDDGRPSRRAGPGRIRQRGRDGLSAGSAHHGRPAHDGDGRAGRMQDMTTCPEDDPVTDGAVLGDRRRKKTGTGHGDLLAGLVPPAGRWTQGRRSA